MEVYAWGSGNYGRLGLGHGADAPVPRRVGGVLNGCEVTSTSCGWYHSAVVTSTGDVALFGSRVTRCLGTAGSDSEGSGRGSGSEGSRSASDGAEEQADAERRRGAGQRRKQAATAAAAGERRCAQDFMPSVLRSFPSRVVVVQVAVGGDMMGAHSLAVSRSGRLYSWGYGPACGLGSSRNVSSPTLVTKFLGTGEAEASARAAQQGLETGGFGRHSHRRYRERVTERSLGLQLLKPRIVKACCGGGFSAVLSADGEVFTFGLSAGGRLGLRTKFRALLRPRRIETLPEAISDLSTGASFALLCSTGGRLISWGDNSKGQLGIGHLQESHVPVELASACPAAFVMQAVAAGDSHGLALDSAGNAYSWGGEGGPMTGQGQPLANSNQVDAAFQFRLKQLHHWWVRPSQVRALAGIRVVSVCAGCVHSLALSADGALFAWGAALQAGATDSAGVTERPEASWLPRLVAPGPKLPLVRVGGASGGGWHSLASARPASPMDGFVSTSSEHHPPLQGFCDGFLLSGVDSSPLEDARVPLCISAVRARLATAGGADSAAWSALCPQIGRVFPEDEAPPLREEDGEGSSEPESSDGGGLLSIVSLHRQRGPPPSAARAAGPPPGPGRASVAADEAAGIALPAGHQKRAAEKARSQAGAALFRRRPPAAADFSSDSDSGAGRPGVAAPASAAPRAGGRARARAVARQPARPAPVFSSDSSGSSASGAGAARARARPLPARPPQAPPAAAPPQCPRLDRLGEAVLAAFARFLHTDSLGDLQIIDEDHPLFKREQDLSMRPLGAGPAGEQGADEARERPTQDRARKGLLLAREVRDLRGVGVALGLERLVRLCDQLLHRVEAPGAPALFVPESTLGAAMWTLLRQTLAPPSRDGPDTRVLAASLGGRRPRGTLGAVPQDGLHYAHAFVLCAGCSGVRVAEHGGAPPPHQRGVSWLRWRGSAAGAGSGRGSFDFDLRDVPADVVTAWLRYLYTQDDLQLFWPCVGLPPKEAAEAEAFWAELLCLAERLGDERLRLYAQDTLVATVGPRNWPQMLQLGRQVRCGVLAEAALTMGLRLLLPTALRAFKVPTGLEAFGGAEGATGDGSSAAGQPEVARGAVDLELERHLLSSHAAARVVDQGSLMALKTSSPDEFTELKLRLSEGVARARRVGAQLQRCTSYFEGHRARGFKDDTIGRALWIEVALLALVVGFFLVPSRARTVVVDYSTVYVLEPLRARVAFLDIRLPGPLGSAAFRAAAANVLVVTVLLALIWTSLKS